MKKIILYISISLFCSLSLSAQSKKEGREKIRTLKIAYLTEQLNLTANEAQKFWPVYNAFDKEQHTLRGSYRFSLEQAIQKNETLDNISEEDSKKLVALKLSTDKKLYEIQKDFIKKIERIISNKKIIKLQIAEIEFGRNLMRKYRRRKP
ncbi:sensor of ECF-type sigma factor [Polaribacter litorisediminis]|uniref:sensor of ECF-type sigma factor n=1 Tax=Polaribacter litorisediminis TaxID=1908341 RepID=UPI001CBD4FA9|nr:sensor of ECF-type sigma factor [Polaribacter litorisediminis]UAM99760.1 sensor of ECF-type sigma factor [Polaribacter litorisediminis]